ncbi:nucleotidyl transferase AbiEii/AbiGii toxin family protein [Pseudoduganella sp. R-34]|uniref:nucleotidyl transferase AbiEii/AbiGii toxin family protein n=1 Tax=unclassified Pseudoduganella TaxID=2637179 RepID=UPI003CF56D5A
MSGSLAALNQGGLPDTWESLFKKALIAIDEIAAHGYANPFWTFGGGTVLMLRYGHLFSKDVDIFVPDLQSYRTAPWLSDVFENAQVAARQNTHS